MNRIKGRRIIRVFKSIRAIGLALAVFAVPVSAPAADFYTMALEAQLRTQPAQSRRSAAIRRAMIDFYAARQFNPMWVGEYGLSVRAERLLAFLPVADKEGLDPRNYEPDALPGFSTDISHLAGNRTALIELEIELTQVALRFATDVSGGRINPKRLSKNQTRTPPVPKASEILRNLGRTVRPEFYFATLIPAHEGYKRLKEVLAKLRSDREWTEWSRIAGTKKRLKPGKIHSSIARIRSRLTALGDHIPSKQTIVLNERSSGSMVIETKPEYYDQRLTKGVKTFQKRHGIRANGIIGGRTIRALNFSPVRRINQVLVNMERYRWLPRELGWRHVLVNQPEYRMRLIENGKTVHSARVIIGKPKFQTPEFSNEIQFVVFNPYWNVPRSIATKEMLPMLYRDPSYLARMGYEVFASDGRRVRQINSSSVRWNSISAKQFRFSIRQPPGKGNALGRVKFMFPNRHSIYLHDTPTKHLFAQNTRAYSHGCVRLQYAVKFAEVLLARDANWTKSQVARAIASGKNRRITLKTKVPIHLTYFTAWVDDQGRYNTRRDIYRRDAVLMNALGPNRLTMK